MNTNEQAPESCPFCGTMTRADNNRRDQTPACAKAERERLTREREEARDRVESLENVLSRMLATDGGDGVWSASRFYEARQDAVALMKEARREWRKKREGR